MGREVLVWAGCSKVKCLSMCIHRILTFPRQWGRGRIDRYMSSQVLGVEVRAPTLISRRKWIFIWWIPKQVNFFFQFVIMKIHLQNRKMEHTLTVCI